MQTRRAFLRTSAATAVAAFAGVTDPAHAFPDFGDLGTLRVGAPVDITVRELRNGEFEFVDNAYAPRKGQSKLFPHAAVVAGRVSRRRS